jgi:hypothetical protein
MSNLSAEAKKSQKEDYNNIPVFYCNDCLSLRIRNEAELGGTCYCDLCGSTSINESDIEEWENAYKDKHGVSFLEK